MWASKFLMADPAIGLYMRWMALPIVEPLFGDRASALRKAVANVERKLAQLSTMVKRSDTKRAVAELRDSWATLVRLIDMPAPVQQRECPVCKHVAMLAAIRCGHCWTRFGATA